MLSLDLFKPTTRARGPFGAVRPANDQNRRRVVCYGPSPTRAHRQRCIALRHPLPEVLCSAWGIVLSAATPCKS